MIAVRLLGVVAAIGALNAGCTPAAVVRNCTLGENFTFETDPADDFVLAIDTSENTPVCERPYLRVNLESLTGGDTEYIVHMQEAPESEASQLALPDPGFAREWLVFSAAPDDLPKYQALVEDWSQPIDKPRNFEFLLAYSTTLNPGLSEVRIRSKGRKGLSLACRPGE